MPTIIDQLPGSAGVEQTLRQMGALIDASVTDEHIRAQAATATRHCDRHDTRCRCASLLEWVRRKLRFVPDPDGVEALHDPRLIAKAISEQRFVYGDCDDYAMYLGALLKSVGLPVQLRAVGYQGQPYQHVYVLCAGMALDPTRDHWSTPLGMAKRETSFMQLDLRSGQLQLGGIKIGKMFKRLFTIKKSSFKLKNIMGAIGSAVGTYATVGLGPILAPKQFGAHSKLARIAGTATTAVGLAAAGYAAGPYVAQLLGPKLTAAAAKAGTTVLTNAASGLMQSLTSLGPAQQLEVAQQVTPDQLAEWEQTGVMPADLASLLYGAAASSAPPQQLTPYTPTEAAEWGRMPPGSERELSQAGMFDDPMTMFILMSVVGLGVVFTMGGGRVRR